MDKEQRNTTQLQIRLPKELSRKLDLRVLSLDKKVSKASLIVAYAEMGVSIEEVDTRNLK